MNICMFTNTYLPHVGGVARSVSTFAEDLRAMGNNVLVVAPTFDNMPANEDQQQVLRMAALQNFNGSDFSVRIPLPGIIEKHIDRFRPDIIHSHHPFLLGDAALRIAERLDLPILFTHHTRYEQYTHYVPLDSDMVKRFAINLATEYANLCNCVIAPSSSIKRLLLERGVKVRVEVVPTGIDLEYFQQGRPELFREKFDLAPEAIIIGHVGRLAREKNLPYLAEAVLHFLKQRKNAFFVVAGSGDAEKDIRQLFTAAGLQDRLILPGVLKNRALADCYRAMDIFVFASQSETQGLVLMEAMAAGVPVIALHGSGVSDVVEDSINGRILPADSAQSTFADALAAAFATEQLDLWRTAALETARRFSRQNCAERLMGLYRETISTTGRPDNRRDVLDAIRKKLQVEWELLQEKTSAVIHTLTDTA